MCCPPCSIFQNLSFLNGWCKQKAKHRHMHACTQTHIYSFLKCEKCKYMMLGLKITSPLYVRTYRPLICTPSKYFSLSLFFKCPTTKRKKGKNKKLYMHTFQVSVLLTKKFSSLWPLLKMQAQIRECQTSMFKKKKCNINRAYIFQKRLKH